MPSFFFSSRRRHTRCALVTGVHVLFRSRRARPPSIHRLQKEERPLELGMIGLGKMGANMAQRLVRGGHDVVGFDPKPEARSLVAGFGAKSATSLQELLHKRPAPRVVWMRVPAGNITRCPFHAVGKAR